MKRGRHEIKKTVKWDEKGIKKHTKGKCREQGKRKMSERKMRDEINSRIDRTERWLARISAVRTENLLFFLMRVTKQCYYTEDVIGESIFFSLHLENKFNQNSGEYKRWNRKKVMHSICQCLFLYIRVYNALHLYANMLCLLLLLPQIHLLVDISLRTLYAVTHCLWNPASTWKLFRSLFEKQTELID